MELTAAIDTVLERTDPLVSLEMLERRQRSRRADDTVKSRRLPPLVVARREVRPRCLEIPRICDGGDVLDDAGVSPGSDVRVPGFA